MATKPPVEVPQGAIRLNTDSQKLEFFAQDQWWQMATDVPTLNGGARGICGSANNPTASNQIQYITIPTTGNATDFGDLTQARGHPGSAASRTRALWGGGSTPSKVDTIDYVTFSSTGNATDFGNRTESTTELDGLGHTTRALFCGGYSSGGNPGGYHNRIDYVTMASTGNAVDFGDLVGRRASQGQSGISNSVRGWFMGGQRPDVDNDMIESIVIATTGNAIDWGSNIVSAATNGAPWMSTPTHGIGGGPSDGGTGSIAKFIFSSHGNTVKWGELSAVRNLAAGVENSVRGVFAGSTPATTNIEYLSMQSEGDAVDFGDLTGSFASMKGCSNAHGGL